MNVNMKSRQEERNVRKEKGINGRINEIRDCKKN